jgi:hypothetical protein
MASRPAAATVCGISLVDPAFREFDADQGINHLC